MDKQPALFHPDVTRWFKEHFREPTEVQEQAWPDIQSGQHTLVAAPTGSGKTLAAFLCAIDTLWRDHAAGSLCHTTQVLYVSPLKALANDIHLNLQVPLQGIQRQCETDRICASVRTGDTSSTDRQRMRLNPPHILATTPESLYILLTSQSGRAMLQSVTTVIVDEIHALVENKRGAHLALSLERLQQLCLAHQGRGPQRIGLSATQKPMSAVADFLVGSGRSCRIVDTGHLRNMDLGLVMTGSPMQAVMANEVWDEIYNRLAELASQHNTTLIFVNTRRLAERAARHLAERLGEQAVTAHHGSLSKEHRLDAEQRLKNGQLRALVATASLELGIDIGDIDLVCQLGSPRSVAALLQRVGRSGHAVNKVPKGRLFPLSRDELVESIALLQGARHGELDRLQAVDGCLVVLAQQIVAEVSSREWQTKALFDWIRNAWPYRELREQVFENVLHMLAQGYTTKRGRRSAYIHYDRINGVCRARKGAVLTAYGNGGAIPDQFDYDVVMLPVGFKVGSLNEDFAFESLPGDIFQLGNTSYRMLKIEQGKVFVEDAKGQPPTIPFWFGEAPGRSDLLSSLVSTLREQTAWQLQHYPLAQVIQWAREHYTIDQPAAEECITYLAKTHAMLGAVPHQACIVAERFFDETGDMHLVIHSSFGSRINRAWGLALRKRFCRKFNFELQAAALEDSIILSLGPTHSFDLDEVARYLSADNVERILIQALLDAPLFEVRWRWNATIALAIKRMVNGKKRPPQWQRNDAEDLVALIFPDQLACLENIQGDREIPDHPLVAQTLYDCTQVAMDLAGLKQLLRKLQSGAIQWLGRDLPQPSPLSQEIINARPYAFLDDTPAEERRTLAVQSRHLMDVDDAAHLAGLDREAVEQVCQQAWPQAASPDELHDALVLLGFIRESELLDNGWQGYSPALVDQKRMTFCTVNDRRFCLAADRLHEFIGLFPHTQIEPAIQTLFNTIDGDSALIELIRSRLECGGLMSVSRLQDLFGLPASRIHYALSALEQEGFAVRGRFLGADEQWCERRLLARMNRYTVKALRKEIEPASPSQYMIFLLHWHQLSERGEGSEAIGMAIQQLEGFPMPAAAWEKYILPARIRLYLPHELDKLCTSGVVQWMRLGRGQGKHTAPLRNTPIVFAQRRHLDFWRHFTSVKPCELSGKAQIIYQALSEQGASFLDDLVRSCRMPSLVVQQALSECTANGLVSCDDFAGLREIISPKDKRRRAYAGKRLQAAFAVNTGGRWVKLPDSPELVAAEKQQAIQAVAMTLLHRYGVVFRKILERESHIPPWRELLYIYRRMEARGEIRGGRFVEGFSGEQFAMPEALSELRRLRRVGPTEQWHVISAADPINLLGIILPGERVPAVMTNKILMKDGIAVAVQSGKEFKPLEAGNGMDEYDMKNRLTTPARGRQQQRRASGYAH